MVERMLLICCSPFMNRSEKEPLDLRFNHRATVILKSTCANEVMLCEYELFCCFCRFEKTCTNKYTSPVEKLYTVHAKNVAIMIKTKTLRRSPERYNTGTYNDVMTAFRVTNSHQ